MYVEMQVPMCDFTGTRYDGEVKGAGAVAQGASGRWCVVMYAGPEFYDALMDLVDQGIVEVIPTTGLTGDDWYKLAGANSHRHPDGELK